MNLLLDTQVFLWLDGDQGRLSSASRSVCADTGNTLWLSVASAWEMQIKIGLGKLRLKRSLAETIASQQLANALQILPVQLAHTLALNDLPAHHNRRVRRLPADVAATRPGRGSPAGPAPPPDRPPPRAPPRAGPATRTGAGCPVG
jgi:PIN domain nuclease of toxin-antitoxin system